MGTSIQGYLFIETSLGEHKRGQSEGMLRDGAILCLLVF